MRRMNKYKTLICASVEDELKADLLVSWFEKFSLPELYKMEEVFASSEQMSEIIQSIMNPQYPVPAHLVSIVSQLREKMDAIKSEDVSS